MRYLGPTPFVQEGDVLLFTRGEKLIRGCDTVYEIATSVRLGCDGRFVVTGVRAEPTKPGIYVEVQRLRRGQYDAEAPTYHFYLGDADKVANKERVLVVGRMRRDYVWMPDSTDEEAPDEKAY